MVQGLFPLDVLARWIHIGTVITLVGGTAFVRFVLLPSMESLEESAKTKLHDAVASRWKRIVHIGIVLILFSGLYNYVRLAAVHRGDSVYHAVLGVKILLALAVFFLASVLVGRSAAFEALRRNRRVWLGVVVTLAAVIVALSGFVKVRGTPAAPGGATPSRTTAVSPARATPGRCAANTGDGAIPPTRGAA